MRASAVVAAGLLSLFATLSPPVAADNADILEAECHKQLQLGDSGCACIGERAEELLSGTQQALVVAFVTDDQAAAAGLQGEMTGEEMSGAANFMVDAPQYCAGQ